MKKIFAILAALTVAAPAGAFIVPPEPPKPEGPTYNTTKLKHRFCYEMDDTNNIIDSTWNKKCVEEGRQTIMQWTDPKKCDDFEGCLKVGMLMNNEFYGDVYFEDKFFRDKVAIFDRRNSPITYFEEFTVKCQGGLHDVALEGVQWERNFNRVHYRYDTLQLTRDICNKAYGVDSLKLKRSFPYIAGAVSCNLKFEDSPDRRDHCKDMVLFRQEQKLWK